MDAQLEITLIECLDALAQGESLEHILARYPQESAQLRPLLEAAASLSTLRREPSEAAKMQSRQKFMAQADLLRRTSARQRAGFLPRFATGFIAAALVAIVLGTGAVAASGSALPGDPFYGLKRTVENVRLQSASSPAQRQELQREFEQRRRDEANELLDARRESEVEFTGPIESLQPNAWIVAGLVVQVDDQTQIDGTPQINRMAEVRGLTGPTGLRASSITIESGGELDSTPLPEATETPQTIETPAATESIEPTHTLRPTTATPRSTATPPPTTMATPRSTATPQPVEMEFTGTANSIGAAVWDIEGTVVEVTGDTDIRGSINVGQRVKVKALRFPDGRLIATRIEPADDSGGSNQNENDNPNITGNENQNENQNSDDSGDNSNSNGDDSSNSNSNGDDSGDSNSNDTNGNDDHGGGDNSNDDGGNDNGN
jgi:hypothetical protein